MSNNPIQTVLEAEKSAREAVESTRQEAEKALHDARSEARHLVHRNEERTQRALKAYTERCATRLEAEVNSLNKEAQDAADAFVQVVNHHLPEIEEKAFNSLWPK